MADYSKIIQLLSINGECFKFKLEEGAIVTELIENNSVIPENNTFDAEWLDKAIQDIINSNYTHNIFISKEASYIRRFDAVSNEFKYFETESKLVKSIFINIDINMILPENRKKFMKSRFYNKTITISEIEEENDIFALIPRLMINGDIIENFRVFCNEDKTSIVLEIGTDISKELFEQLMTEEIKITVFTFPRKNEYEEQKYTKNIIDLRMGRLRRLGARLGRVIETTTEYFQIPLDKGLVYPENILVFSNGKFIHEAEVECYYPNLYRVVNTPAGFTRFTLYIFYNGSERTIKNELALYHDNIEACEEYQNNTVPEYIKGYVPISIDYSIKDYRNSHFNIPIEYKVDVLQRLISFNSAYVKEYLKYCNLNSMYYLDIKNVDLKSKIRLDNKEEIDVVTSQVKFKEPRYVFIFRKDLVNHNRSFRIFIDGEYYVPDHLYEDTFYEFIYIPISLIKNDSLIAMEILYGYTNSLKGTLYSFDEEFVLTLGEFSENVLARDIQIYTGGERLPSTVIKGFIETDGGMMPFKLDTNTRIGNRTVYLRISDSNLYGQPIEFIIEKNYHRLSFDYHEIEENIIEVPFINDENINRVMVYKNSRLLSSDMYEIGDVDGQFIIRLLGEIYEIGDVIHVELNPYFANEVLHEAEISEDGLIDLVGKINKPIDTRWYDIYLNGRKLEDENLTIISPFKAIIKNVKSTSNLVFIEKNRDEEYFVINNKNIEDLIWEKESIIREQYLTSTIENSEGEYERV